MSDPTEQSQRTPLSSSTSHAGGTSALSVTVQPEQDAANSVSAETQAAAPDTPETDGTTPVEGAVPMTPDDSAEADQDAALARGSDEKATAAADTETVEAAPGDDIETRAEVTPREDAVDAEREINVADAESAETFQQDAHADSAPEPIEAGSADDAAAFVAPEQPQAPVAELAPETAAEPVEETADATRTEPSGEIAAIGSTAETAVEATEAAGAEMADTAAEIADTAAETLENIGESVADAATDGLAALDDAPADEPAVTETALGVTSEPSLAASQAAEELRAKIRDNLARNEVHQDQALKLFQDVSQKFAVALEEAGQDAARITLKMMEFAQANLQNNLHWAKDYAASRSVPELLDVQRAYLKRQFDLLNSQAEMLREMTVEMTSKSAAQLKKHASQIDDQSGPR